MYTHEAVELCPHCMFEHYEKDWSPSKGYRAICMNCGESILLCDECSHAEDNQGRFCDWERETCKCFRDLKRGFKMIITNYDEMLTASNTIKKIADEAVRVGTKNVQDESDDAINKMATYIYETLKPIFNSPVGDFTANNLPYDGTLYFCRNASWGPEYKAQLRNDNLGILVYFSEDKYIVDRAYPESVVKFAKVWPMFKSKLDASIREAIQKYNKKREQEVDGLAYLSKALERFEV